MGGKERNVGLTADAAGLEARATGVHSCANFRVFRRLGPSCRFILFGLGLFVESGDFASEVRGQFCQGDRLGRLEARRGDGGLEDEGSGFETHRGGSFGIVEQVAESFEGPVGEGQGFFAELDGADVVGSSRAR